MPRTLAARPFQLAHGLLDLVLAAPLMTTLAPEPARPGDGVADPGGRAGDEGGLSGKVDVHA